MEAKFSVRVIAEVFLSTEMIVLDKIIEVKGETNGELSANLFKEIMKKVFTLSGMTQRIDTFLPNIYGPKYSFTIKRIETKVQ